MSNDFKVLKDGEKLPKFNPDKIDWEYMEQEADRYDRYIKENLENEREKIIGGGNHESNREE